MKSVLHVIDKLKLNVLHIDNVPESYSSEVYRLTLADDRQVYLKIPFNRGKLFRELQWLNQLNGVVPVPQVLSIWEGDERTTGALLLSAIQGVPCTGEIDAELAFQIGQYHAMLHEAKPTGYGDYTAEGFKCFEPNDWRQHIRGNFEKWKQPCKEILDAELYERCLLRFDEAFSALPEPDGPCAVHMDFRPGNILVSENKVVGIIDFESARGGSSEIDFTKINRYIWQPNPHTRQPYIKGYESIRPIINLESVLPFYNFYDAISAVVWCKSRGVERNESFLQENMAVLKESVVGRSEK